jgi:hypothetical protein
MSKLTLLATPLALAIALIDGPAHATDPDTAGMKRLFADLEKGLRAAREPLFKSGWLPESYTANLVGGSGLPGSAVYRQGTRKKWYLKPDLDALQTTGRGAPFIVPCDIWAWEKGKALDRVHAALIYNGKTWIILGAGEKLAQVQALARRWQEKKPLAPPRER